MELKEQGSYAGSNRTPEQARGLQAQAGTSIGEEHSSIRPVNASATPEAAEKSKEDAKVFFACIRSQDCSGRLSHAYSEGQWCCIPRILRSCKSRRLLSSWLSPHSFEELLCCPVAAAQIVQHEQFTSRDERLAPSAAFLDAFLLESITTSSPWRMIGIFSCSHQQSAIPHCSKAPATSLNRTRVFALLVPPDSPRPSALLASTDSPSLSSLRPTVPASQRYARQSSLSAV